MKSIILSKVKKDKMQKTRLYYSLYKKVMKSKKTEKVRSCLRKKLGIEIICEFPKSDRNTELVTVKMNKVVKIIVIHFQFSCFQGKICFL